MDPIFITLGAVVIGWLLSELSHVFRAFSQKRAALGRVLVELLEMHHYLRVIELTIIEIRERLRLTPQQVLQSINFFEWIIPQDPQHADRYNNAVSEVAATHPILAFALRRKEQVPLLMSRLRTVAGNDAENYIATENFLRSKGIGALEDLIVEVARAHGVVSWYRVKRRLNAREELPAKLREHLDELQRKGLAGGSHPGL